MCGGVIAKPITKVTTMDLTGASYGMRHRAGDGGGCAARRFAGGAMLVPLHRRPFARLRFSLAVLVGFVLLLGPARADFRVDVGDVIEIVVTAAPELQRRLPVRIDGNISFPLIGTMRVAGLTASELQDRVQAAIAAKVFQRRMPDGSQVDIIIGPDEVTASVVEYRPVYVNGDVLKPGEYVYRPSMTVRQAVTAAGSYSLVRFGTGDRFAETANFEAEFGALWAEYVRVEARIWGLRKLLGQDEPFDFATLVGGPITRASAVQILALEAERVAAVETDQQRRRDALVRSLKECDDEIQVLAERQKVEDKSAADDAEELERATKLYGRGELISPRVTDARRAVMLSASRRLETTSRLMQVRRLRVEMQSQLDRLDVELRMVLLRDLQEANGRAEGLRSRINGLMLVRQRATDLPDAGPSAALTPQIMIVRKEDDGRKRFLADEDTELHPGDVLQVSVSTLKAGGVASGGVPGSEVAVR